MRTMKCLLVCLVALVAPAHAQMATRYASLRTDKAYLREGPTFAHRVLWIYRRKGYPVRIVAAYDAWRRVEDADGTVGWMNASMLSDRRTILVIQKGRVPVRAGAASSTRVVAWAAPGVVADLKACEVSACEIATAGVDGWIDKKNIWGVDARDVFE
jgi:SH3-like domain-containing protein